MHLKRKVKGVQAIGNNGSRSHASKCGANTKTFLCVAEWADVSFEET